MAFLMTRSRMSVALGQLCELWMKAGDSMRTALATQPTLRNQLRSCSIIPRHFAQTRPGLYLAEDSYVVILFCSYLLYHSAPNVPHNKLGAAPVPIQTLNSPTPQEQRWQQHLYPKAERRNLVRRDATDLWKRFRAPRYENGCRGNDEAHRRAIRICKYPLPTSATAAHRCRGAAPRSRRRCECGEFKRRGARSG